jgi:hypothetical protein
MPAEAAGPYSTPAPRAVGLHSRRATKERRSAVLILLLVVLTIAFVASLLPVLYPETIVSLLGTPLNAFLGDILGSTLHVGNGTLVTRGQGEYTLTLEGVLAVYGPVFFLLLLGLRGK